VVVHRQGSEAELRNRLRVGDEVIESVRMTTEVHQREMSPELHLVPLNRAKSSRPVSTLQRATQGWPRQKAGAQEDAGVIGPR
jgi:hypothetical protein